MFRQIISAVEFLHQQRIVHRDLKVSICCFVFVFLPQGQGYFFIFHKYYLLHNNCYLNLIEKSGSQAPIPSSIPWAAEVVGFARTLSDASTLVLRTQFALPSLEYM